MQRFINNSNQINMFRLLNPPIFRNTRLCVTACGIMPVGSLEVEELRFQATSQQHRAYIMPQAVTHSLVLLKMGGFNA